MKNYSLIVFFLCGYVMLAQNKESLYDFNDLPQSLMLNPGAEVGFKRHIGVPLLSQIHVNAGFSGASVYDVFADDGRSINEKIETTLSSLSSFDYGTLTQQLEILYGGWKSKKFGGIYFSGGLYEEIDIIQYFPKDFAVLAYEGNRDYVNVPFQFSDISGNAEFLTVYHFGFNKKIDEKLIVGARVKLYSSIFNIRSVRNSGTFTTFETENGNNIYQHLISNADVSVKTSGYASLRDIESEDTSDGAKQVSKKFVNRALLGGNLGLGVDVGFTYKHTDQWTTTGSLTDLGVIFYTKDVETYQAKGSFAFDGFETPIQFSGNDANPNFLEELEEAIPLDTLNTSYTAMRPLKVNGSVKYSFNRDDDGTCDCFIQGEEPLYTDALGFQLFSQFRPKRPQFAASVFYYKRLSNFLRAKVNYTIDDYSYTNIGLLVSTHINVFNFYLSADNLLAYRNLAKAQAASVQLGFNIIM